MKVSRPLVSLSYPVLSVVYPTITRLPPSSLPVFPPCQPARTPCSISMVLIYSSLQMGDVLDVLDAGPVSNLMFRAKGLAIQVAFTSTRACLHSHILAHARARLGRLLTPHAPANRHLTTSPVPQIAIPYLHLPTSRGARHCYKLRSASEAPSRRSVTSCLARRSGTRRRTCGSPCFSPIPWYGVRACVRGRACASAHAQMRACVRV